MRIFARRNWIRRNSNLFFRAKGFVLFDDGTYLFNYVGGRHDFEKLTTKHDNEIVFIGQGIKQYMKKMINQLRECEVK